jgi:hypothetical protein
LRLLRILFPSTRRQILASLIGLALAYILSTTKLTYPYRVEVNLSQIGIFIAACSGGPAVGAVAGLIGSIQNPPTFANYDAAIILPLLGLIAGALSTRIKPLYSAIIAWLIIGLAIYITAQSDSIIATQLYWILTVNTYLALAGALSAELATTYLGSMKHVKSEKAKLNQQASEDHQIQRSNPTIH